MVTYAFDRLDDFPSSAISRCRRALESLGVAPPSEEQFLYAFDDWLNESVFHYARALKGDGASPDWHLVRVASWGSPFTRSLDPLNLSVTRTAALAGLLAELDRCSVFPEAVSVAPGLITFADTHGSLLASIESIPVMRPDLAARHRVEELLKGIRAYGDLARCAKRLSSLPGLEGLRDSDVTQGNPRGSLLNLTPDSLAAHLRAMLSEQFAIDLKQHQAQEFLAALLGLADWQQVLVRRDSAWAYLRPTAVTMYEGRAPEHPEVTLYPAPADGIFEFARRCKSMQQPLFLELGTSYFASWNDPILNAYRHQPAPMETADAIVCSGPLLSCNSDPHFTHLAQACLDDPSQTETLLSVHIGTGRSLLVRYRNANRRRGITPQNELWVKPWLVSQHPISRLLTFLRVDGVPPEEDLSVVTRKAILERAVDGWHLLKEDSGRERLGLLDGLTDDAASAVADRFGIRLQRSLDGL